MSINKVILLGNIGKEPEIKSFDNGGKIASFTLATTKKGYTTKNGTTVPDKTEWHNVKCFSGLAGVCERFLHKGSKVYVEGEIVYREYEKDGQKRFITEILVYNMEMCDKPQQVNTSPQLEQAKNMLKPILDGDDDDVPF